MTSVIICTHDRADMLARTLAHVLLQTQDDAAEVIVVDNASMDTTPALLERLATQALIRALTEPRLGLSRARNRGLAEARGEIVVFLDDDAVPRPGWLDELRAAYSTPEIACVGGRILLHFPSEPPKWLTPDLYPALSGYDLGDVSRRVGEQPGEQYPFGANISFRTDVARSLGGFSTRMGLRGRVGLQQEETDLCFRIEQAGMEIRYAGAAVVDHWIFAERLTPGWFLQRAWLHGQSNATFQLRNRGLRPALGLLRRHYGQRLAVAPYAAREPIDPVRFVAECRRREAFGYLVGLVRGVPRLRTLRREANERFAGTATPGASQSEPRPWQ